MNSTLETKPLSRKAHRKAQKALECQKSTDALRAMIKPGDTVYTVLRHVSRSGMMRHIDVVLVKDGQPHTISSYVADVLGYRRADNGALKVGGCGMDMGFHVVYSLGCALWPDGWPCIGEKCPSNDHSNGDRDYTPGHCTHRDGGYALRQRWL